MVCGIDFVERRIISFEIMLFIYSLLIGFGTLVSALLSRMWGEASNAAATARMNGMA